MRTINFSSAPNTRFTALEGETYFIALTDVARDSAETRSFVIRENKIFSNLSSETAIAPASQSPLAITIPDGFGLSEGERSMRFFWRWQAPSDGFITIRFQLENENIPRYEQPRVWFKADEGLPNQLLRRRWPSFGNFQSSHIQVRAGEFYLVSVRDISGSGYLPASTIAFEFHQSTAFEALQICSKQELIFSDFILGDEGASPLLSKTRMLLFQRGRYKTTVFRRLALAKWWSSW